MNSSENVSYYLEVPFNSSKYFTTCWIKIDPASNSSSLQSIDPSFAFSSTESLIAGLVNAFQSTGGTILNLLVFLAVLRSPKLRKEYLTPSIISIATTDVLFSLYTLSVHSLHWFTGDMPLPYGCQFFAFVMYVLWLCSAFNLLGVAILRCVAVYFPWKAKTKTFQHIGKAVPVMAWILSSLWLTPTLIGSYGRFGLECQTFLCKYIDINHDGNRPKNHPEYFYTLSVVVTGMVMLFLNIATYVKIKKSSKRMLKEMENINVDAHNYASKCMEQERKIGKMLAIISISFFILYLPSIILSISDPNVIISQPKYYLFCHLLATSIGIIDPLAYIIYQEKCWEEIKILLKSVSLLIDPTKCDKM